MHSFVRSFDNKSIEHTRAAVQIMLAEEIERLSKIRSDIVIVHLQSARGSELNGLRCSVTGCDPPGQNDRRVHVKTPNGERLRLRSTNLCLTKNHSSQPSKTAMHLHNLKTAVRRALSSQVTADGSDMRNSLVLGQLGRYDLLREVDSLDTLPTPVSCCAWNVKGCCDALTEKERVIAEGLAGLRPACYGDGLVHLERMAEGLVSTGDVSCSICLEVIAVGQSLSSLPCGHQFHEQCIKRALDATRMACPICRQEISGDPGMQFNSFALPFSQRLNMRFCEFIDSGMCERCQMAILEKMQFGRVKLEDGRTMMAVAGQPTEVEIGPLNIKNS